MALRANKIAIVGAGSVGATIAYACLIRGVGRDIALYDVNAARATAETLDLNHGIQFVPMAMVEGSDDVEICRDAGVVVITAGAKQKVGQSRMDQATANAVCRNRRGATRNGSLSWCSSAHPRRSQWCDAILRLHREPPHSIGCGVLFLRRR